MTEAQTNPPRTAIGAKLRKRIPESPAVNGTNARPTATKRPTKTVAPP